MSKSDFHQLVSQITSHVASNDLDEHLEDSLNAEFGPQSALFQKIQKACLKGIEEGWMCNREAGGIRYGRVFKQVSELKNFSVDVVDMENVVGPHHVHPAGEIDMIMPQQGKALLDGHPAGWAVYPPGSAHKPSVSEGRALVLYLLPEGSIEFIRE